MSYMEDEISSYELYLDEYTIEDVREDLQRIVDYFKAKDYHNHAMKLFMEQYRQLPLEVAEEADAFCVDEEIPLSEFPDWMKSNSLNFVNNSYATYWGRCVFPVKDVYGKVAGFCGWDPYEDPKYLDSKNYGYKAKTTMFYGMEKFPEYYKTKEPVFLTEGLMCTLYLRWKGFNAISSLGSWLTPYQIQILKRFGNRLITVPDNDESGNRYVRQLKRELPKARVIQLAYGKDVDGCRKFEDGKYESQLLKDLTSLKIPFMQTSELIIKR